MGSLQLGSLGLYKPGPVLLLGPKSGFMALRQLQFLLISQAPDTTEGQENGAAQSWPQSSLAEALRRKASSYTSPGHNRADPVHRAWVSWP